jgi:hypothetical protein
VLLAAVVVAACSVVPPAGAATIVQPAARPFVVPADTRGRPLPFTIVAAGFQPGRAVLVEQCDGKSPSAPSWSPTLNCDLGSSPAAVIAGSDGRAVFDAHDHNHAFTPFVGESPEALFSCGSPGTCTVRVSTNNSTATADQVFFPIALPHPTTAAPAAQGATPGSPGSTSASAHGATKPATAASGGTRGSDPASATATSGTVVATTPSKRPDALAFTGLSALLGGIALVCLGLGIALYARARGRQVVHRP